MFNFLLMLGKTLIVVETLFFLFWIIYYFQRKINIVDIAWGLGLIAAALVDFILGLGFIWRKIVFFTIVTIWAGRLVLHLTQRYFSKSNDPRYDIVLKGWPLQAFPALQVLFLFVLQGFLLTILTIPFILINQNDLPYFSFLEIFGLVVVGVGVLGESIADYQLNQFKKESSSHQICRNGLWKYSRHPNYFFEWVVWAGYSIIAFPALWGWLGVISPILMLYLLLKVSGIPSTEAYMLRAKGDAYRLYQTQTNAFFPWFSK